MAQAATASEKLGTYRRKRDFSRTAEPRGSAAPPPQGPARFVVQRHRARRLHYDVRLEIDGVLVSWAVPKGPTLDPSARRLAVRTEDHPLEYFDFEGVIPSGEYGGGDVVVWDWGTWDLHRDRDAATALAGGELHVELHDLKLRGRFVLVRRGRGEGGSQQWLLLHKRDEHAVDGWDPEDHPESVLSGRTNDEVAEDPEASWDAHAGPASARVHLRFDGATDDELAALDALGTSGRWDVSGRELRLTNLDKVLAPGRDGGAPVTKRDLIRYHATIAPLMLPHLAGRPVNLHRYPDGVDASGFWHKEVPEHAPDWISRWRNPDADPGETQVYFVADHVSTLAWLANYGAIELHPWTSTTEAPHQPSYALFDIDPGERTTWDELLELARLHRTALGHLGVQGFPKVTGRRGIQVWVPVEPGLTFGDTAAWVEEVSRVIGHTVGHLVSWRWSKKERNGLARLDYSQNAINKTLVVPYGVRAAAGAPVSAPIAWDELDDPALRSDRWDIRSIGHRLDDVGDLFEGIHTAAQPLPSLG